MLTVPVSGDIFSMINAQAAGIAASEDSSDFLLDCGSRAGYDYLGTCEKGAKMQQLYDDMYEAYVSLWNDTSSTLKSSWMDGYCVYAELDMYGLTFDEATIVYYTFKGDFPLCYFSDLGAGSDGRLFYMPADVELMKGSRRAEAQKNITAYVLKLAAEADKGTTVHEKVRKLHDAMVRDLEYAFDANGNSSLEIWAHNITGAAEKGEGVCETYARTFQAVLNYLDIDNYFVNGVANNGDHAWNMAQLDDGGYYYFDVTWDDMAGEDLYFAKGSNTMSKDHRDDVPTDDPMRFLIKIPKASEKDFDPNYKPSENAAMGDVNGDGRINVTDISMTAGHVKGVKSLNDEQFGRAEVSGDGRLTVTDISKIAAHVKGVKSI